jgi:predicted membrane channel-forming protein YqfA (hemolysin III family)
MFLARLDYGGICLQICGSGYPMIVYTFACGQVSYLRYFFLATSTLMSTACFIMLMIPKFGDSGYQKFRGNLFIALGISSVLPFAYLAFNK